MVNPSKACKQVQALIGIPATTQVPFFIHELNLPHEGPILVVRLNPEWTAIHGQAAADAVLDYIAEFHMPPDVRRDSAEGHRLLFHFNISSKIKDCRRATLLQFPAAFALSPAAVRAGAVGASTIPLAFSAIIHKIGVRQDDVEPFQFFYL